MDFPGAPKNAMKIQVVVDSMRRAGATLRVIAKERLVEMALDIEKFDRVHFAAVLLVAVL